MSDHTPGPWTFDGEYVEAIDLDIPLSIATIADCGNSTSSNGRIIAAAPDLLEACKYLLANAEASGWSEFMLSDARAAVNKAEGNN